ncbi:hypothetical protein ES702_03759 [subsurface metagenome]
MSQYTVFISYSRKDSAIIGPLTRLMGLGGGKVFRDNDSIAPGQRWELLIADSIRNAKTFVVFWSKNSSKSNAVQKEIVLAINQRKDVVPVLLDNTTLNIELAAYQWLDFQPLMLSVTSDYRPNVRVRTGTGDPNEKPYKQERLRAFTATAARLLVKANVSALWGPVVFLGGGLTAYIVARKLRKEIEGMSDTERKEFEDIVHDRILPQ